VHYCTTQYITHEHILLHTLVHATMHASAHTLPHACNRECKLVQTYMQYTQLAMLMHLHRGGLACHRMALQRGFAIVDDLAFLRGWCTLQYSTLHYNMWRYNCSSFWYCFVIWHSPVGTDRVKHGCPNAPPNDFRIIGPLHQLHVTWFSPNS
jgi:hypothetical protein